MSGSKLELVALEFLERRLLGECIDKLAMTAEQRASPKADFFLFDRSVIVEVKNLTDDRLDRMRAVIDKWRRLPGWPAFVGAPLIQDVLLHHPCASDVNQDLREAATGSIEQAFKRANRQIRETKRTFGVGDVHGILMLLNEAVDVFDPKVLWSRLQSLFLKKAPTAS